jgi:DNA-3-methyladenine glycosylase II
MSFDPALVRRGIRHLQKVDPVLGQHIEQAGPFRLKAERRRFVALARSIVAQQISGKAASAIWKRLQQAVKPGGISPATIAAMSFEQLRAAGISPQKAAYLHDLAARATDGSLRLNRLGRLPDDDVIAELIQVKGIGVWTAQMFLMFSLCRIDVFAPDDLGLRAAIRRLYDLEELPDRQMSLSIAEPWRPYQTIASWYLWRTTEDIP